MRARLVDTRDLDWARALDRTEHDFYHRPEYATVCAGHEGGQALALIVDEGDTTLLLPLLLRETGDGGVDAASPYGYPGPLVAGPGRDMFLEDALEAGLDALREAGVVSVFVRCHPLLNPVPPVRPGVLVKHADTVVMDLASSEEYRMRAMRHNHLRDIRRAVSEGYRARVDEAWAGLDAFLQLYRDTMERHRASPFYQFDDAYFHGLRSALGGTIHLILVELDDRVVGAGLFVVTGSIAEYHLAGFDDSYEHSHSSKLLIVAAARWAAANGARYLHLGGGVGAADDGLLHFKLGFSPIRRSFHTLRAVLDVPAYERLVAACGSAADATDLTGYFPAYRSPAIRVRRTELGAPTAV